MSGWPVVPLEQIVDPDRPITYGIVQPGPDLPDGIPYVRVVDIKDGTVLSHQLRRTSIEIAKSYRRSAITTGDILVSIRGHVGRTAIVPESAAGANLTQDTARVAIASIASTRYVRHFIESPIARHWMAQRTKGVAVTGINLSDLRQLPVPLPPLPEQRRIADILDKADSIRRKRKEAITLTEELLRSAFLEMFGDPVRNEKGWPEVPFADLVRETQLGLVRAASDQSSDRQYPYVRMNAIRSDGHLNLTNVTRVDASPAEAEATTLVPGDFLFNTRNSEELVGKTAVFSNQGTYLFNNNILRVRFKPNACPEYVWAYFQSPRGSKELAVRKSGTTSVFAIYYKSLATLPVLVPPKATQVRFAQIYQQILQLRALNTSHSSAADHLFSSLVDRAFRGELTSPSTPSSPKRKQLGLFGD